MAGIEEKHNRMLTWAFSDRCSSMTALRFLASDECINFTSPTKMEMIWLFQKS